MTPVERDDVLHALQQVQAFYGKELTEVQLKLWWSAIRDQPADRVKRALADYTKGGRYAPKPRDILDICGLIKDTDRAALPPPAGLPAGDPHLAKAWRYVISQWDGPLSFDDDVDAAEIDGYLEICNRHAKEAGDPLAIPPSCWLETVWGYPCDR